MSRDKEWSFGPFIVCLLDSYQQIPCLYSYKNRLGTVNKRRALFDAYNDFSLEKRIHLTFYIAACCYQHTLCVQVGLCTNLRSLVWCGEANSDLFFPRCYLLSSLEEKDTFISESWSFSHDCPILLFPFTHTPTSHSHSLIHLFSDNYHFTTALNLLKLVINQHWGEFRSPNNTYSTPQPNHSPTSKQTQNLSRPPTNTLRPPSDIRTHGALPETTEKPVVPEEAIELALRACTAYVSCRQHDDIEEGRTVREGGQGW